MIHYSIDQRFNPTTPHGPRKYYAFLKNKGVVKLRQVATRISRESTISLMDTMAVLEGLLQVIPDFLKDGKIVRLGELGSFRVIISSEGTEKKDNFNTKLIKGVRLNFYPGPEFRHKLNQIKFVKL